jgi:hypothetical protein
MARDAQKSGHPWEHAKGSTTEKEGKKSVKHAHVQDSYDWQNESKEAEEYLNTVSDVKDAELKADIKRWSAIEESGKFTKEEIESLKEAERDLGDRLHRKRKLYDKTTKKAMQFARDEGEASGHARYRMGSISREMDGIRAKMKEKEKEKK